MELSIGAFVVYIKENDRSTELVENLQSIGIPHSKVLSLSRFHDESELHNLHRGPDLYQLTIGRNLLIPEIGAFVGHHRARLEFLKSNYEYGIILDDDARLNIDPKEALDELPNINFFCLSLSKNINGIPRLSGSGTSIQYLHVPSTMSAHAYVLDRYAAQILVQHVNKYGVTSVADWPYPIPKIQFFISRYDNFVQAQSDHRYSVAVERDEMQTVGTEHSLLMPIPIYALIKRIWALMQYDFGWQELLHTELILRFRARRFFAIQKLKRIKNTYSK